MNLGKFTTFYWNNQNSKNYNIYITNSRDLEWVSTPDFSNDFVAPLGQNTSYYSGINLGNRKLTLNLVGIGLSSQDFRKAMSWLDIKNIGVLNYDYNNYYGYQCKIDSISTPKREYISLRNNDYIYNFTFSITFVTIGDSYPVSLYTNSQKINISTKSTKSTEPTETTTEVNIFNQGDLPVSCEIQITAKAENTENTEGTENAETTGSAKNIENTENTEGAKTLLIRCNGKDIVQIEKLKPGCTVFYETSNGMFSVGESETLSNSFINKQFLKYINFQNEFLLQPGKNTFVLKNSDNSSWKIIFRWKEKTYLI